MSSKSYPPNELITTKLHLSMFWEPLEHASAIIYIRP
jgi:hypothetical protein